MHNSCPPDPGAGGSAALRPPLAASGPALAGACDYGFAFFVFLIASDAFTFLGLHGQLWLAAYGYLALRLAVLIAPFVAFVRANAVYLAYPALCALSVLWSDVPLATATFAAQLLVSVLIALFVAMRLPIDAILRQLLRVYLLAMAASLATLGGVLVHPWDDRGNFRGVFLSKNAFGHRAVLFVIGAVLVAFLLPRAGAMRRLACLAGLVATAFMVSISGSATAIVLTVAFGLLVAALELAANRRHGAALVATPLALGCALAALALVLLRIDPVAGLFDLLGRTPTMTGRTILWQHGWAHYLERPLLGFGAAGFWQNPAFASEIAALQSVYGDGVGAFHDLALELLVALGPLGLVAHGLAGAETLRRAALLLRRDRDAVAAWVIATTCALYAMAAIGAQLFNPHAIPLILLVAMGAALGKRLPPRPSAA